MSSLELQPIATDNSCKKWETLQAAVEISCLRNAFALFRSNSIEPVLIKGWASALYYPTNRIRETSDIDLAFAAADYEPAFKLNRSETPKGLPIDLHCELRHLDSLKWKDLFVNSKLVDLDGTKIRVLRPEDHLRVLAVHWLTDGGWFRDRLWDIFYAVDNRDDDFDWNRCLNVVGARRRRWVICVIGLTNKYFGLYIDDLPFAHEAKDLPLWLVKAVEREWASEVRLLPLTKFLSEPKQFYKQVKKRLRPNPIHATIDMEGSFDAKTRMHYQIGTIIKRIFPAIAKLLSALRSKRRSHG